MISFIISVGAFVIGAIVIYYIAVIGLFLALAAVTSKTFWGIVGAITVSVAIMVGASSKANADSIDVNLTSWHSDYSYNYNSNNFGLGYTHDLNYKIADLNVSGKVGLYYNSYYKKSVYALIGLTHKVNNFSFGANVGFVTGYGNINKTKKVSSCIEYLYHKKCTTRDVSNGVRNLNKMQFVISPTAIYRFTKEHAITISVIPMLNGKSIQAIGLQYNLITDFLK